jgi:hypothetical protein
MVRFPKKNEGAVLLLGAVGVGLECRDFPATHEIKRTAILVYEEFILWHPGERLEERPHQPRLRELRRRAAHLQLELCLPVAHLQLELRLPVARFQ